MTTTQPKTALITGITGQDGSYLAEFLLEKGYVVHGIKRRASSFNTQRVDHIYQDPHVDNARFALHYGDLSDSSNLTRIIQQTQPDEIYNLGAQSHVAVSFESPEYTADVDGMGVDEVGYAVIASAARQSIPPDSSLRAQCGNPETMDCRLVPPRNDEDKPVIRIDPRYFRPTEVETLLGDPSKAKQKLGWVPEITLDEMVQEMVATDLADAKKHALLKHHGYNVNVSVE